MPISLVQEPLNQEPSLLGTALSLGSTVVSRSQSSSSHSEISFLRSSGFICHLRVWAEKRICKVRTVS